MISERSGTPLARLGAIDVGTNSIRLIVAEVERDGSYRVLDEEKEVARLGEGLEKTGWLAEEPMERALQTIAKMKAIAEGQDVSRLRAIATSAVREARNGATFCRLVTERCELPLEVISTDEEARLAFRSVTRHFQLDGKPTAVVDIGGGSVEVVLAAGTVVDQVFSMPLGAVRLTERVQPGDPWSAEDCKLLRRTIDKMLREIIGKPPFKTPVMVGSGGTFSTLAEILQYDRTERPDVVQGCRLAIKDVVRLRDQLADMPLKARRQVPGLSPQRADIIVAGAYVITQLAKRFGTREIWVNDKGIRDGLLLSMIAELRGAEQPSLRQPQDRMEGVRQFARKCRVKEQHAEHVARIALNLWDGLAAAYRLPPESRDILQAAALLHEVGYLVHHVKHHKHAYHLIVHAELPGFSTDEAELVANVVRYSRGAKPKKSHANFNRLKPADARLAQQLSSILRIADGLDRTHSQQVHSVSCAAQQGRVRVTVESSAEPRVELWAAERKAGLFKKTFDAELRLAWHKNGASRAVHVPPLEEPALPPIDDMPTSRRFLPEFEPQNYLNRELSWLEFNGRVLEEARDRSNPWLERLKFLAIFSSNLDEFFEIRVAGLQQQLRVGVEPQDYPADGLNPHAQLTAINRRAHELVASQYEALGDEIFGGLAAGGVAHVSLDRLNDEERAFLDRFFFDRVYPVLTPLAIDPGHPFPHVHSKSLNIALILERATDGATEQLFAVVQVPSLLDRVVVLPRQDETLRFVLLEEIIAQHLPELFGRFTVLAHTEFRVTRNADLTVDEDEADDLLDSIEKSLRRRHRGDPVRLEISAGADERFVHMLVESLGLEERDVYRIDGPLDLNALMALHQLEASPSLKHEPLVPRVPASLAGGGDIFDVIAAQDILLHHPYESFGPVVDFIEQAADDPNVLAIKQTLYRTNSPSPIISALARAAQNGKQVTALVELKARYDEENNIVWARSLEEAGVHVVYGVVGLKTHCKAALVVRREGDGIRRYVHLGTGNYNAQTARVYTDLGLFTADADFGTDTNELFNLLTGYSQGYQWKRVVVAPFDLLDRVLVLIERERVHAQESRPARIIVKMNSLVEPTVIDALYRASQAGVPIDLAIRGICCLRPGVAELSENIRVTSVVDKFLEHSRIFYFENGGEPEVYLGSADWMPRNFFRRIELMFPVIDPRLRQRIVEEILPTSLADNVKARELLPSGEYHRLEPARDQEPLRSQLIFQSLARESTKSGRSILPLQPRTLTSEGAKAAAPS